MKSNTVLIIDDEKPARDLIRNFLSQNSAFEILDEADNGYEGCLKINQLKPDLVFLDIQMPKINGIEMLELLDSPVPYIIFSTAFDNYAVKAFEKNALDYLLKPYSKDRFDIAIQKFHDKSGVINENIIKAITPDNFVEKKSLITRIPVKYGSKVIVIDVNNILYIEAQDDYVKIVTDDGKYLKQSTMKYFENNLTPEQFIRIHRSYILNMKYLIQLESYDNYNYKAVLKDSIKLPVSRSGTRILKKQLDMK